MLNGASNPLKMIPEYQAETCMTDDQLAKFEGELLGAYNPDEPELNNGGRIKSKENEVDPVSYYILHSWNLAKTFETPTKLRDNKNGKWTTAKGIGGVSGAPKAFGDFISKKQLESGFLAERLSEKAKASIAKGEIFKLKRGGTDGRGNPKDIYTRVSLTSHRSLSLSPIASN